MRRTLASVLLLAGLVAGTASPTSAATMTGRDARGDAQTRYDITSVQLTSGTRFSETLHVRDLRGSGTQSVALVLSGGYVLLAARGATGRTSSQLMYGYERGVVPCRVAQAWRPGQDTVAISFPRSCLGTRGLVTSQAYLGRVVAGSISPADHTRAFEVRQG